MATPRLPIPGQDDGTWGAILNDFLSIEHNANGTLKLRSDGTVAPLVSGTVPASNLGTGTPSGSNFLRGDGTWAAPGTANNATTSSPGLVQLAGDLGGTATAPTVPGLATKAPLASPAFTGTPTVGGSAVVTATQLSSYVPSTLVGQSISGLPGTWDAVATMASFLDTASMGTLKALGAPSNAFETEFDAVNAPPVVSSDGTITCGTNAPVPTASNGATTLVFANSVRGVQGAWSSPGNALGSGDTNRATFTSSTAYDTGTLDLGFAIPALPTGAAVFNVALTPNAFATSDSTFPYTIELIDSNGNHIGSAAQYANSGGTFTFTGITVSQLSSMYVRFRATHANSATSATVLVDACGLVVNYATAASLTYHYRSEFIYTSDRIDGSNDYTNFRFTEGKRIRVAFDVLTHGLNAQSSDNWCSVFQGLGKAIDNSFPYAPLTVQVINGQWRVQHGAGVDIGYSGPHEDERWYRWELDILLGRAGTGTVKIWCDGVSLGTWTPSAGTFYAGNGNNALDLQWIYFKNGLYGGATTSPTLPSTVFKNRRFTVSNADGSSATTWRGPQTQGAGIHIFKRNPATDMPY